MKYISKDQLLFVGIQVVIAVEWLTAGLEKYASGEFSEGLSKTLGIFASNNPHAWYASLLIHTFAPNASWYAQAVMLSETCIGIGIAAALITLMMPNIPRQVPAALGISSLAVAIFLNVNFYLAAGWTGPSTAGFNVFLGSVEALCLIAWVMWLRDARRA